MLSDTSWEKAMQGIPADERIILLQYNAHLFEGSKAPTGIEFKSGWNEFKRFWTRERYEPADPLHYLT